MLLPGAVDTNLYDFARFGTPTRTAGDVIERSTSKLAHVLQRYGMDPALVADVVFDGIAADRFWLLSHPEITDLARERVERLCAGQNP